MPAKKLMEKCPVSGPGDPESVTDPKKAQKFMKEIDEVVRPGLIKKKLEKAREAPIKRQKKSKEPGKRDRGQKHK
ncbi:MAG: hypothetical protein NT116_03560 [Candidatus Parcubacteria bacterium]|nr:hypothetical protein [Candidatus Parcubacteria bacterium]